MYYRIKEERFNSSLIELPKGSKVVSAVYECERGSTDPKMPFRDPEHWTVVYIVPVSAGKITIERMKGNEL